MLFNLTNLCFSYNSGVDFALKDATLSLDSGFTTGLAGANGSGKTTLIKVLLGQLIDFQGGYSIDSVPVADHMGQVLHRFNIGYAPDDVLLDDYLSGYEIMEMVATLRKIPRTDFEADMALFTEHLRLEDWFRTRQCKAYSTGMKRKTAICLAYLGTHAFVVLDEPTNGLDPLSVYGLKLIIRSKKDAGSGTLIASHILDFVEKTCDRCILLCKGAVSFSGTMADLKQTHANVSLEDIYFSLFNTHAQ